MGDAEPTAEFRFPLGPEPGREVFIAFRGRFDGIPDVDHVIEVLTLWRDHYTLHGWRRTPRHDAAGTVAEDDGDG